MSQLTPRSQLTSLGESFCAVMNYPSLRSNQDIYVEFQQMARILQEYADFGFTQYKNAPESSNSFLSSSYNNNSDVRRNLYKAIKPKMQNIFWCVQNCEDEGLSDVIYDFIDLYQEVRDSAKQDKNPKQKFSNKKQALLLNEFDAL